MAKKQVAVTLRKPPPADPDAFVAAAASAAPSTALTEVKETPKTLDEVIARPDGRAFREVTLLVPAELARRLSIHCMEADRDVSNFVAEIVRGRLEAPAPEPLPPPPPPSLRATLVGMARSSLWRISPWAR